MSLGVNRYKKSLYAVGDTLRSILMKFMNLIDKHNHKISKTNFVYEGIEIRFPISLPIWNRTLYDNGVIF